MKTTFFITRATSGIATLIAVVFATLMMSAPAHAIKKCKDADGKMHYGDTAVEECENSKVTTLTDRGFVKEEEEAPKTDEQIRSEAEELALIEREEREKTEAEEEKRRILSIYEREEDIDRQRDNQVRSVQSNIDVHESYLNNMEKRVARFKQKLAETDNKVLKGQLEESIVQSKTRMEEYSLQLESLEQQKAEILERFKKEKETYLALKNEAG